MANAAETSGTFRKHLKLLNNQRWFSFCRAWSSKGGLLKHGMSALTLLFYFDVITSCRTPDGTRIAFPFVGGFPACVIQDRTPRKVVVSVRPADRLTSEKPRRPIAQPLPSWEHEPKWQKCLARRSRCLSLQEDNICLHQRVALRATAVSWRHHGDQNLARQFRHDPGDVCSAVEDWN